MISGSAEGRVWSFRDVTECKKAEEALQKSEKKFQDIFDNSSDAIFIHDMEEQFLEVNEVACSRLGYSRDELLQMKIMDIDTQKYADKAPERIQKLSRDGHLVFEAAHRCKDGTGFPVEISSRKIEYDGSPCILSVSRDISERKKAEKEIAEQHSLIKPSTAMHRLL